MVKLKLTLKSKRPSTVYAANGKQYRLQPGSNTLDLAYDDYLALAKSLGIKPVENKKKEETAPVKEEHNQEPVKEEVKSEEAPVKEPEPALEPEPAPAPEEAPAEEPVADEPVKENNKEVDYSTWSYTKLKAEYKAITGKACKLKKDEVIAFLQEHNSNVE